jgi:hypothetical protein
MLYEIPERLLGQKAEHSPSSKPGTVGQQLSGVVCVFLSVCRRESFVSQWAYNIHNARDTSSRPCGSREEHISSSAFRRHDSVDQKVSTGEQVCLPSTATQRAHKAAVHLPDPFESVTEASLAGYPQVIKGEAT